MIFRRRLWSWKSEIYDLKWHDKSLSRKKSWTLSFCTENRNKLVKKSTIQLILTFFRSKLSLISRLFFKIFQNDWKLLLVALIRVKYRMMRNFWADNIPNVWKLPDSYRECLLNSSNSRSEAKLNDQTAFFLPLLLKEFCTSSQTPAPLTRPVTWK